MKQRITLITLISLVSLTACSAGVGKEISSEEAVIQANQMAKSAKTFSNTGGVAKTTFKREYCSQTTGMVPSTNLYFTYTLTINKDLDYHFVLKGKTLYERYNETNHRYISEMAQLYLDYTFVHNIDGYDAVGFVKYYDYENEKNETFSYAGTESIPYESDHYFSFCWDGDPNDGEPAKIIGLSDIAQTVDELKDSGYYDGSEPFRFYSRNSSDLSMSYKYKNPHIGDTSYGNGAGNFIAEEYKQVCYEKNSLKSFTYNIVHTNDPSSSYTYKQTNNRKTTVSFKPVGKISLPSNWRLYLINR